MGHGKSALQRRQERFEKYLDGLATAVGHVDRHVPMRAYCAGLLLPGDRKSVEPMAARLDPGNVRQRHQSLHHFVADSPWSDEPVVLTAARYAIEAMQKREPIRAWIVDDTGIPKKGAHSVGVARQYCGILGKQDNCQVAVSLSVASEEASVPVAYRLYLPEEWAKDAGRRKKAKVPKEIRFERKWEIALDQIRWAKSQGVPTGPVVADAGYGNTSEFREQLIALDLPYVVGVQGTTSVWPPGVRPLAPKPRSVQGRPPTRLRRAPRHRPTSVRELALSLPVEAYRRTTWRQGTQGEMSSRFAAVRVIVAHLDYDRSELRPEEWLLIEWPEQEKEPTKYWLSTLPANTPKRDIVEIAMLRWRIERDYQELKSEIGLDHFEGRSWRGFHHHATLCVAAYAFLVAERCRFSPLSTLKRESLFAIPALSEHYRPRGAPTSGTA